MSIPIDITGIWWVSLLVPVSSVPPAPPALIISTLVRRREKKKKDNFYIYTHIGVYIYLLIFMFTYCINILYIYVYAFIIYCTYKLKLMCAMFVDLLHYPCAQPGADRPRLRKMTGTPRAGCGESGVRWMCGSVRCWDRWDRWDRQNRHTPKGD